MSQTKSPTSGSIIEKEGAGALSLSLHALVILNISDHWTRQKVQHNIPNPRVIGALVGIQNGREVEIFNSFELVYRVIDGNVVIDQGYLQTKQEQFKRVFPTYEFLGWYSTGTTAQPADIEVHRQFTEINENPLYLVLDTVACSNPATRELPITIYESELHLINEHPMLLFVKIPYKIETGEAERISVDHVAKVTPSGGVGGSALSSHLLGMHNAIHMLSMRIKILLAFLEATKAGKFPKDHGLLRRISCLCSSLPAADSQLFRSDFMTEYNDTLLITYLASITKGSSNANELIDKFNAIYERGRRRGFF